MDRSELIDTLELHVANLRARGFDVRPLIVEPAATEAEVESLERALGVKLPVAFRYALLTMSKHLEFAWFTPAGFDLSFPVPFHQNFSGELHWGLQLTKQFREDTDGWVANVFPDRTDSYDAVWHNKLAFQEVGNGDYLALDLASDRHGQVVYLSHDDGEGHGHVMATDFIDLLERWVPLACPGGEDWQWIPFTDGLTTVISPNLPNGQAWRTLLSTTGDAA